MRRKRAKSLAGDADVAEGASGAVSSPPAVSWADLLAKAEGALDEKGLEAQERRKVTAGKYLRKLAERGISPKWDLDGIRRALAAYYADYVLGDASRGFRRVFADCGVPCSDFLDARDAYPELRMVFDYIQRQGKSIAGIEAEELNRQAQNSQKRLVTEEGCELNQRAVELSLKATMKGVYGDSEADKDAAKRKPIVYKFENLTANFIMSPGELAAKKLDGSTPVSEVVDV